MWDHEGFSLHHMDFSWQRMDSLLVAHELSGGGSWA